nr:MAG TPA: hypothetical protein [Caudoviricetes sp.]
MSCRLPLQIQGQSLLHCWESLQTQCGSVSIKLVWASTVTPVNIGVTKSSE